jgi:hypothetical protein
MAIRKRGSKRIAVDGILYLWQVRKRKTPEQGIGTGKTTLVIAAVLKPSRTLIIPLERTYDNYWLDFKLTQPILPNEVEQWIRQAVAQGWQPLEAGKPFEMKQVSEKSISSDLEGDL